MKNRIKTISGALALTFMLLFGAAAFAHTTNAGIANPNMGSTGAPARNEGNRRRHRRHHRRWFRRRMDRR
jgi:hypothetical protein